MNNSSTVLREILELKQTWRNQNFCYTREQKARYEELLMLRRAFVTYWYENDMVHKNLPNSKKAANTDKNA